MPPHEDESTNEPEDLMRPLLLKAKPPLSDLQPSTLATITKLNLPECGLKSLPANLGEVLPNLSILFCPKNKFEELPAVIGACSKLQMVSFKSNGMKRIHPDALKPQLRWLILTDNALEALPTTIGNCERLQKLMLSGNALREIPDEISNCTRLELVRLASNHLSEPPMALLNLPNLAWAAFSANPFLSKSLTSQTIGETKGLLEVMENVAEGDVLGQGASGITREATLADGTSVALKTYFGTMTSDGNPQEERQLALQASSLDCDCLIRVLGQTKQGSLIMELLQEVTVLAGPPSMESCSRDCYEDDACLTPTMANKMVSGLLDALLKLHSVGICHGDFYGHNILMAGKSVKLSDFGAAFSYDRQSEYGACIERIELRAFGHLVEEIRVLTSRNITTTEDETALSQELDKALRILAQACTSSKGFSDLKPVWDKESVDL